MHILFVDLQYEYGMKHRGTNTIGQKGFKEVFERLGHKVSTFYYDKYLTHINDLQSELLKEAQELKPDLVYFILFGEQFYPETLKKLMTFTKTVNWFGDDQWRFETFTSKYAPLFSWSVTTDPFSLTKYKKISIQNVYLSQWAAIDDQPETPLNVKYQHDVTFVGGSNSTRRWIIDTLKKRGIRAEAFGFNWPNGTLSHQKMIATFQTSKINLNLSNSISWDWRYLTHHWKNPIVAWKSPKASSQIKARNFEIPYYGGFQLTEYVPGLERYFNIGQEVACYKDIDEMELLIRYYLDNDTLREEQKGKSFIKARNHHTYFHRHKEFFENLK